jgi:hypothetical protein
MTKNQVAGIVRTVLAALGGVVGGAGIFNDADWAELSGAITVIAVAVWSFIEKKKGALPPVAGMMLGGLLMCSGCATTANDVSMARIASDTANNYYQQPNNTEVITMEGSNVTWTIAGANRIVMSTPVPSKSVYPRDASTLSVLLSGATDIAKTATYGVLGYQGIKSMQAVATKAPTVVTTEKLVPVTGAAP